jgi:hypothetical protein
VVPFLRNSSNVIQSAEYGLFKVVALLKQAISWLVCHFSPGQTVSSCEVYLPAAWCSQPCFGEEGKFGVCGTAEDGCSVAVGITVVGDQYYNSAISNEKLELLADMGISYWGYPLLHYMVTTEGS